MTSDADPATSPDALLRLTHCPGCGYALDGLAPEGTCPECGGLYDQSVVVLHGFGRGGIATARPAAAVFAVVTYAACAWLWIRDWLKSGGRDLIAFLWAAGLTASLAWGVWKRWGSDMPGLVQVRLGADGASQLNNPGAGKIPRARPKPWRDVTDASVRPAGGGTVRLRIVGPTTFWRGTKYPVDAELRCTPEQAAALRARIAAWRAGARGDAAQEVTAGG